MFICWFIININAARKDVAVEMYKKGIMELEKGIAVDVNGEGKRFSVFVRFSELIYL